MRANESLSEICSSQFFRLRVKLRSERTKVQYRLALSNLAHVLGRPPVLTDLTDDTLAALTHYLLDQQLTAATINERVGRIKTLWTWVARRGMVPTFPTLDRLPVDEKIPRAWSVDELRRLFASCAQEQGRIAGIPAASWWLALQSWLWCTSERKGATFSMTCSMIDLDGMTASLPGSIRKGKKAAVYDLWPECCSALRAIWQPARLLVFPWPYNEGTYYNHYTRILRRAGLPTGREYKTHCLRVTHATWRAATGGDASQALGHASPATTKKHYIDPRIARKSQGAMFWPTDPPPRAA